ncbi:MAG: hypothetical protein ABI352_10870 [Candidatus Dormibacter sp.]
MEPRTRGRRGRAQTVSSWWGSLDAQDNRTLRATHLLPTMLLLAAGVIAMAMPLPWHHLVVPADVDSGPPTTQVLNGLTTGSWLLVVAGVDLALSIRTYVVASTAGVKWTLTALGFVSVMAMFGDYIDWSLRGSLTVKPYYGPGFFLGLGAAVLTAGAAALAWRVPD